MNPEVLITCGRCGKTYNPKEEKHITALITDQDGGKWLWCRWERMNNVTDTKGQHSK